MSDSEIARLEREVSERVEKLAALRKPMTREEVAELAKTDPREFNRKLDAREIDLAASLGETEVK